MGIIWFTVLTLCGLGILSAAILYFVAQKFRVHEDPRVDEVEAMLPGANCGACGYPGCRGFADALVNKADISALYCTVGGASVMNTVAGYLGKAAPEREPLIAVVRCSGACEVRPRTSRFDGARSCAVETATHAGATGCSYGCLGHGDCCVVCEFDAIHMNPLTELPEVVEDKCTACGKCVTACPKAIIELRRKGPKGRRVFVSCVSRDRGGVARRACSVACIGCGKCVKACTVDAITLANNLAYIDHLKCRLCRACVPVCPTNAIHEINFPPRKKPVEELAAAQPERIQQSDI